MKERKPAVSGMFYPSDPSELNEAIQAFPKAEQKKRAFGVIVPHAGYIYSGAVANLTYSSVIIPDDIIILGPNHTGVGPSVSIFPGGAWQTPFGSIQINEKLARLIMKEDDIFQEDHLAHLKEHSIEVQLPFLKFYNENVKIVPICLKTQSLHTCREIGEYIFSAVSNYKKNVLIVASSDMTHYESAKSAKIKDEMVLARLLNLDYEGLYNTVLKFDISMCGFIPATIMLKAIELLGCNKGTLVSYGTSGDVTGDNASVVAYAGMIFSNWEENVNS